MTYFFILMIASVLFIAGYREIICKIEAEESTAWYKANSISRTRADLKASMSNVEHCLAKIKEFKAKGYTSTVDYYRNELAQQRAWMNYHRACLASLKSA